MAPKSLPTTLPIALALAFNAFIFFIIIYKNKKIKKPSLSLSLSPIEKGDFNGTTKGSDARVVWVAGSGGDGMGFAYPIHSERKMKIYASHA